MEKTFSIKTLGCKLNQYESSMIAGQFLERGWTTKPFGEPVDLVIVNTCTVTNKSDKKCRNYIRQGANLSKTGKVLVTGCLAEREMDFLKKMPEVFAVHKNSEKEKLYSIVNDYSKFLKISESKEIDSYNEEKKICHISNKNIQSDFPLPYNRTRGLLKIQDGCDGKCSYCIVPYVRGKPVSRNYNDILTHAEKIIDTGCSEIILTGITIGKFDSNLKDLADLIEDIIAIDGKFRVRVTSIEPKHISDKLISLFESEKVCSHIHVPLQSGSDRILTLMNRPYTINEYSNIISKIKYLNDEISIGTDLIVGFPDETEEDFNNSLNLINDIGFSYVHQFTFSPRFGTSASNMQQNNSSHEIVTRSKILRKLSLNIGLKYRKRFIGRVLPSVIETKRAGKHRNAISDNYIRILLKNTRTEEEQVGSIVDVRLESVDLESSTGVFIQKL